MGKVALLRGVRMMMEPTAKVPLRQPDSIPPKGDDDKFKPSNKTGSEKGTVNAV